MKQCRQVSSGEEKPMKLAEIKTILAGNPTEEQLAENFQALMDAVIKAKPSAVKGQYLRSVTLVSTMGPGVKLNTTKLMA